jgi:hypothetical protein
MLSLLFSFILIGVMALFRAAYAGEQEKLILTSDGCALEAAPKALYVTTKDGKRLMALEGLRFQWSPPIARVGKYTLKDGVLRADFNVEKDESGKVKAYALFSCEGNSVKGEFFVSAPKEIKTEGIMFMRMPEKEGKREETAQRFSFWKKPAKKGDPMEARSGNFRAYRFPNAAVWEWINGRSDWSDPWNQHLTFKKVVKKQAEDTEEEDVVNYISQAEFSVTNADSDAPFTEETGMEKVMLKGDACAIEASSEALYACDKDGKRLMKLSGFRLAWSQQEGHIGKVYPPENGIIRVDYAIGGDATGKVDAHALFRCEGDTVKADIYLTAPAEVKTGGAMLNRETVGEGKREENASRVMFWQRHSGGGEPFEIGAGSFRGFHFENADVWEAVHGNVSWSDPGSQHISFRKIGLHVIFSIS